MEKPSGLWEAAVERRFGLWLKKIFSILGPHKSRFALICDMVGLQAFSGYLSPDNLFQLSLFLSCPGLTFCPLGNKVKEQVSLPGAGRALSGPSWTICLSLNESGCEVLVGLEVKVT